MNYLAIFLFIIFGQSAADKHDLTVNVANIESIKGEIEIGIFNTSSGFLKEGKAFKTIRVKVKSTSQTIEIKDLPTGNYAISMYHDVNGDGKCNLNFFGIPTEPYGFSNNFRPKLSAPNFNDCNFAVNSDLTLQIKLKR